MQVEALLCDAATIREQLLHILGGGITQVFRDQFPAPLGCQLALMLTIHPSEATERHRMRIVVLAEDGAEVGSVDAEFGLGPPLPQVRPGAMFSVPLVLDLRALGLPRSGRYSIELLIDSQLAKSLPFEVMPPPQQPLPTTEEGT